MRRRVVPHLPARIRVRRRHRDTRSHAPAPSRRDGTPRSHEAASVQVRLRARRLTALHEDPEPQRAALRGVRARGSARVVEERRREARERSDARCERHSARCERRRNGRARRRFAQVDRHEPRGAVRRRGRYGSGSVLASRGRRRSIDPERVGFSGSAARRLRESRASSYGPRVRRLVRDGRRRVRSPLRRHDRFADRPDVEGEARPRLALARRRHRVGERPTVRVGADAQGGDRLRDERAHARSERTAHGAARGSFTSVAT